MRRILSGIPDSGIPPGSFAKFTDQAEFSTLSERVRRHLSLNDGYLTHIGDLNESDWTDKSRNFPHLHSIHRCEFFACLAKLRPHKLPSDSDACPWIPVILGYFLKIEKSTSR